ncbi:MAG: DNA polymerase III subunit [Candidatus Marinimicrobia bacterium]|nr:DNA polymerase III subunit [Candidatus Neomarinimicrobiota bacterium]
MIFELIGQEAIADRFRRLIHNRRIGSGYLFAGPEGSGKTSMALNVAAMLLCRDPQNGEPCGTCPSCTKMRHLNHPNFHFVHATPRAKSPSDSDPFQGLSDEDIAVIREERARLTGDPYADMNIPGANQILIAYARYIKKELAMKPAESDRQVVLVYRAELAGIEAFNSLLKILEEPPARTTFILTTPALDLIPVTIRSRCQIVKFNPVPDTLIREYLVSRGQDDAAAQRIARLCGGNVRQAKALMDADFSEVDGTLLDFWRIMMGGKLNPGKPEERWVTAADIGELIENYTALAKNDAAAFRNQLRFMIFFLRDAQLLSASPEAEDKLINTHLVKELEGFVRYYPGFPYFEMIRLTENTLADSGKNMYIPALLANLFLEFRTALLETRKR